CMLSVAPTATKPVHRFALLKCSTAYQLRGSRRRPKPPGRQIQRVGFLLVQPLRIDHLETVRGKMRPPAYVRFRISCDFYGLSKPIAVDLQQPGSNTPVFHLLRW